MLSSKEYIAVLLLVAFTNVICASLYRDKVTNGTELLFSFVVHRHGDRTPLESSISFSDDPETLAKYSQRYGYGQLTDAGKRTGYRIGEFIRRRYNELLSPQYNKSEIYVRSTDSTRAKMTALTELAAVYPPGRSRWNETLDWTPVPYTTVPVKYDFNLAILNCPTLTTLLSTLMNSKPAEMEEDQYREVYAKLGSIINYNFTEHPLSVLSAYDVFLSQLSLGMPLNPTIKQLLPRIQKLAAMAWNYLFGDDLFLRYQAGVLLNEFYEYANLIFSGENTPRVRVYSGHDANVYTAMLICNIPAQGVIKYGGAISLELRKVTATGKYVVLPVYLRDPREPEEYLQVTGCDLLCDIDQFYALTSHNALNETEWRSECDFSDDLEFDTSSID